MNYSQLTGIARIAAPIVVGILTKYVGGDAAAIIGAILTGLVSGGWSANANTTSNLTQTVAAVPGLQVAVNRAAAPELQKLASDPNVPDVVPVAVPLSTTVTPTRPF